MRWVIAWAVCFLVYLTAVWSDWPRGPGTLGIHMFVIAGCFIPAMILAIVAAVTTARTVRTLPRPLRILGFVPLACTVAVFLFGPPEFR